jgi:hypothetical protein
VQVKCGALPELHPCEIKKIISCSPSLRPSSPPAAKQSPTQTQIQDLFSHPTASANPPSPGLQSPPPEERPVNGLVLRSKIHTTSKNQNRKTNTNFFFKAFDFPTGILLYKGSAAAPTLIQAAVGILVHADFIFIPDLKLVQH